MSKTMKHKHKKRSKRISSDSDSESSDIEKILIFSAPNNQSFKRKSREKKSKKRKRCSSTNSSSEDDRKKKTKKDKKRKQKNKVGEDNRRHKGGHESGNADFDVPLSLMNPSTSMAPMTKNEWEKKQSSIVRVFDEVTGRYRLIKGDGEVIEEIVSKDRHNEINRQATKGDGMYFQLHVSNKASK